jgi:uncharacterized protein GlcG (DUF336 family)
MRIQRLTAAVFATMLLTASAMGQEVRIEKNISVALASEAATAALQFCTQKGWKASVAVVDRAGNLKAFLRGDGAGPHTVESSRRKAFTAATLQRSTAEMMDIIQKNPGLTDLKMIDGFLLLGGAVPIHVGDEVIGAPGGNLDDQCAEAGINKIRDRLK